MLISKSIKKIMLKFYIRLHNFSYSKISRISKDLNKGIHPKHMIMKYYRFFRENINENSNVLDVGCGNGYITFKLAKKARKVVGIDVDKRSIKFAKKFHNLENINYILGDVIVYKFTEKFDFCILSNVLEHINKRVEFLKKIKEISNVILIRVPMINRSWLPLFEKELGLDYRSDQTHFIEYTLESFRKELTLAELKLKSYSVQFGEIWARVELV